MTKLSINDLELGLELDRDALANLRGGVIYVTGRQKPYERKPYVCKNKKRYYFMGQWITLCADPIYTAR